MGRKLSTFGSALLLVRVNAEGSAVVEGPRDAVVNYCTCRNRIWKG